MEKEYKDKNDFNYELSLVNLQYLGKEKLQTQIDTFCVCVKSKQVRNLCLRKI